MRIYLDVVLVLNGLVNLLLLSASARLLGNSAGLWRRIAAAGFGAVYACATFVPQLRFWGHPLWRAVMLALMLIIAFGLKRRTIPAGAIFVALSMALGGLVLVLSGVLGAQVWLVGGRAFYCVGFGTLILTAGAIYLGAWLLLHGAFAHTGGDVVSARLELRGKSTELRFLRDTGNTLRDPFTGLPLPVVEGSVLARLLPHVSLPLSDAPQAMSRLCAIAPELSARLVPFRAVGTAHALLLAVKCDALVIGGRTHRGVYVALSPTAVSEHGEYEGLIGEGG